MDTKNIDRRRFITGMAAVAVGSPSLSMAQSGPFPNRLVKIVVPWPAGGGGDVVVRLLAPAISSRLGQPVIVENRPGATGSIGSGYVAKSAPDGYSIMYGAADSHSIIPHLYKKLPYDARKGFTAIAPIGTFPYGLCVHPSVTAKTIPQFAQVARDAREKLTAGSWGVGSSGHVLIEALKIHSNTDLLHVPYQGTAPLMQALISGEVVSSIMPMPMVEQYARSGAINLLAVASPKRLVAYPDVPTFREQGVPIDTGAWVGWMGPANMPPAVLARLHEAIDSAMTDPQVLESLNKLSVMPERMPQQDYQSFINKEYDRWGSYINAAKITIEQ